MADSDGVTLFFGKRDGFAQLFAYRGDAVLIILKHIAMHVSHAKPLHRRLGLGSGARARVYK